MISFKQFIENYKDGKKKGKTVFYASINKGKIKGVKRSRKKAK